MQYTLHLTNWKKDKTALSEVRRIVFIHEQQVPEALEWDEHDELSTHILVTFNQQAIACGRLKPDGHIGRMAVLKSYRHKKIGSEILNMFISLAKKKCIPRLYLHAQTTAIPFYEKHGFKICSEEFMDANIPHNSMELHLTDNV